MGKVVRKIAPMLIFPAAAPAMLAAEAAKPPSAPSLPSTPSGLDELSQKEATKEALDKADLEQRKRARVSPFATTPLGLSSDAPLRRSVLG